MLNINTTYPTQTQPGNASYPNGVAQNVSVPGDGTGTPWELQLFNDFWGFFNAVVADAGITVSGVSETALASDVLAGLKTILLQRSELKSLGGNILAIGDAFTRNHLDGLRVIRDTASLMTTKAGAARTFDNSADIVLSADLQKDITTTWALGAGGLPAALTLTADTWYRRFLVGNPDGSANLCWDVSPSAVSFFADAAAIAAGYTDPSLFRRYGWTFIDGSSQILNHFNDEADPRRYTWDVPQNDANPWNLTTVRSAQIFQHVPSNCLGRMAIYATWAVSTGQILITESQQSDTIPSISAFTLRVDTGAGSEANQRGDFRVDVAQQLQARVNTSTATLDIVVEGWRDEGIIA